MPASAAIWIRSRSIGCGRFEADLLRCCATSMPDILDAIRKSGDLRRATEAKLKSAVEAFAKTLRDARELITGPRGSPVKD